MSHEIVGCIPGPAAQGVTALFQRRNKMRELNMNEVAQIDGGLAAALLAGGTVGAAVIAGIAIGYAIDYSIDKVFGTHLVS
jgi:lactobin A/cerein 7B family class IIb bacteriocin